MAFLRHGGSPGHHGFHYQVIVIHDDWTMTGGMPMTLETSKSCWRATSSEHSWKFRPTCLLMVGDPKFNHIPHGFWCIFGQLCTLHSVPLLRSTLMFQPWYRNMFDTVIAIATSTGQSNQLDFTSFFMSFPIQFYNNSRNDQAAIKNCESSMFICYLDLETSHKNGVKSQTLQDLGTYRNLMCVCLCLVLWFAWCDRM